MYLGQSEKMFQLLGLGLALAICVCSSVSAGGERPPSKLEHQLKYWAESKKVTPPRSTNQQGRPLPSLTASQGIGTKGELLLQDFTLIEKLASFNRERIPERVVHAKGAGAHGYFEVTHDISKYTKAKFLNGIGKRTPVMVRFSTVGGELGSADTLLDPHGFATKFYTEEGIYDLVGNNIESFPIRDPMLFADLNRSRKRNPGSNYRDPNMWLDFTSLRPETSLHLMHLMSDIGRPDGFRRVDGFGVHTFKLVNQKGDVIFNKFHWRSLQPSKALTHEEAEALVGTPDYKMQDLYDAIGRGEFPCWNMSIQVMTVEQANKHPRNPFDITRTWRKEDYPLIPVGKMCLDRNPANVFAEIEQLAFAPNNMVPGIEPSPDRMLAARLFAYQDAQRYRLGVNHAQLPVNRPLSDVTTYMRDGKSQHSDNGKGHPNYFPNSFGGSVPDLDGAREAVFNVEGLVARNDVPEDEHVEARIFLERDVDAGNRKRLVAALSSFMAKVEVEIRERVLQNICYPISTQFGDEVKAALNEALMKQKKEL